MCCALCCCCCLLFVVFCCCAVVFCFLFSFWATMPSMHPLQQQQALADGPECLYASVGLSARLEKVLRCPTWCPTSFRSPHAVPCCALKLSVTISVCSLFRDTLLKCGSLRFRSPHACVFCHHHLRFRSPRLASALKDQQKASCGLQSRAPQALSEKTQASRPHNPYTRRERVNLKDTCMNTLHIPRSQGELRPSHRLWVRRDLGGCEHMRVAVGSNEHAIETTPPTAEFPSHGERAIISINADKVFTLSLLQLKRAAKEVS